MAPLVASQSLSTSAFLPPPQWGALRAKVQELAPAPVQTTDQWARSCIDRATWAPEVPANPCSLSATLAAGICCLVQFSVEQTGLCLWTLTLSHTYAYTHFSVHTIPRTLYHKPTVTHFCPYLSHHPPSNVASIALPRVLGLQAIELPCLS